MALMDSCTDVDNLAPDDADWSAIALYDCASVVHDLLAYLASVRLACKLTAGLFHVAVIVGSVG